jgi:peptide/nickel transport system ATP-binding protein/oligopeptide transport system ATP-binding protein
MTSLLELDRLSKTFRIRGRAAHGAGVRALHEVDLAIGEGEAVGLIGESGSGKSTLARIVAGLDQPTAGAVRFGGTDIAHLSTRARRPFQRDIQMIFQDSRASLNPRLRIRHIVAEPLVTHGLPADRKSVIELLERVGLNERFADFYPHQLSGGQRQRVSIARAISVRPRLIVADEPVSALDISVQAQVLNLLKDLQQELGTAFLFISHDLGVVRFFCDRVSVLYLGRLLEEGPTEGLLSAPGHPYTRALASAAPTVDIAQRRQRIVLRGELPSPENPPPGCCFHTRCPERFGPACEQIEPELLAAPAGVARCHLLDPALAPDGAAARATPSRP